MHQAKVGREGRGKGKMPNCTVQHHFGLQASLTYSSTSFYVQRNVSSTSRVVYAALKSGYLPSIEHRCFLSYSPDSNLRASWRVSRRSFCAHVRLHEVIYTTLEGFSHQISADKCDGEQEKAKWDLSVVPLCPPASCHKARQLDIDHVPSAPFNAF